MNRQLTLFCAMLRKDLRLFWPIGALISGLLLLRQFPDVIAQLGVVAALMQIAIQLGVVLLMLVVCYEDAVVSLQHDWLTRPISGLTRWRGLRTPKVNDVALGVNERCYDMRHLAL